MARKKTGEYETPVFDIDRKPFDSRALTAIVRATRPLDDGMTRGQKREIVKRLNAEAAFWRWNKARAQSPATSETRKTLASLKSAADRIIKLLPITHDESVDPEGSDGPVENLSDLVPWQPPREHRRQNRRARLADSTTGRHVPVNPHVVDGIAYPLDGPIWDLMQERVEREHRAGNYGMSVSDIFGAGRPNDVLLLLVELLVLLDGASALAMKEIKEAAIAGSDAAFPAAGIADKSFVASLCQIFNDLFGRRPALSRDKVTREPGGPCLRFVGACFRKSGGTAADETLAKWITTAARQARNAGPGT